MNAPDRLFVPPAPLRVGYRLEDSLAASSGPIFITGTQALVRLPLMQRALDAARGLDSAGFVSGYRGSPLGAYDQQLWRARERLDAANVRFLPAVNEELAATAVLGSQQVECDPQRTVPAVFGLWYGKGPGVDRAADALKHGHARGASPHGGVLVVAGDDHGCVSSSMAHQSDFTMISWRMPVLSPASVAELIEFGLYGWALSRHSGAWVGIKAISEVVESAATVDLDALHTHFEAVGAPGLHYRPDDTPGAGLEARMVQRLDAVREFARLQPIDRTICAPRDARLGIVTCGKAHFDLLEALRRIDIGLADLERAGIRFYKVGLAYPIEPTRMLAFARGLDEVLVVEEKGPVVEQQMRALLYDAPAGSRPRILGKCGPDGAPLLAEIGELRPSRVLPVLAEWLARHRPELDRRDRVVEFVRPPLPSNAADSVRRVPYFCSGCPHNTSTVVPAGSRALSGIGCHAMAMWMDRDTSGLIQMGGEGVDWISHAQFTRAPHVFQNLGDGTYFHSGYLAIRQAVAAGTAITYKILVNDAVAMTGGQPADGVATVDSIARQVRAEGVQRIAVVSDEPRRHAGREDRFPPATSFHDRTELDAVQRELRATPGVTVLLYDQTCAAEKRRRRKRGTLADPPRRLFINEAVCDGCGDCAAKSNCLSVVPVETPQGRKRQIDQSSCNKDYRCADGFCPSFVTVQGGGLRRPAATLDPERLALALEAVPEVEPVNWRGPYDLLVTGVGGTGVVTVGAVIAMAAHLEGRHASVLDFMGFAQKGGSVLSHVRLAASADALNQARIDTQQADAVLACDAVVAASDDALQSVSHGRTRIVANRHVLPVAAQVTDPDAPLPVDALLQKLVAAAGEGGLSVCDAHAIAGRALGDTMATNIVMLGYAWQRGIVPLSRAAIERALELNGVAVEANLRAFRIGRLAAHDARALEAVLGGVAAGNNADEAQPESLEALMQRLGGELVDYQGAGHAARLRRLVEAVAAVESRLRAPGVQLDLAATVARNYAKLLMYKDEYEVARLYSSERFRRALQAQFEGDYTLSVLMAPPLLARRGPDGLPRKIRFGRWVFPVLRALAAVRRVRGTPFDVFGYTHERRIERALPADYAATIEAMLPGLDADRLELATRFADIPASIRGFGHVKLRNLREAKRREAALARRLGVVPVVSEVVREALAQDATGSAARSGMSAGSHGA
ncbi:MAG: indolepyruvate ferredoxin oxidoreductase family protein [Lautropia sp.]|nr:MAG: indolepyruvate ferredoxin oxidoreductase family protein [Pseudomonadota bacterium]MBC6960262.1 indolepyruvate ferredoxin oxidoreductase family protein [Lautropia sp.]MCL4702013.1 indolepyruvate ferredoxin oxidoreductase family protein [Burkholderiaceae bacterium]MDL1906111.1 indolepyruvate ferredoxin oxidoreductase family protein [Betaproteobacteria bacterium PRO1]RIK91438.1 MAG: pyruvate ferredoxin oxidoreductase [Burkholderiales bacterium]